MDRGTENYGQIKFVNMFYMDEKHVCTIVGNIKQLNTHLKMLGKNQEHP